MGQRVILLAIKTIAILAILLIAIIDALAAIRTRQSRHAERCFPRLNNPLPVGIVALGRIAVLVVD